MTNENLKQAYDKDQENAWIKTAKENNKYLVFLSHDGCEVTVTSTGYVLYNVDDWY